MRKMPCGCYNIGAMLDACPEHGAPPKVLQASFPKRMKIRQGWEGAGRTGTAYAEVMLGQYWTMIQFDDEEDPDNHKSAALEEITD